MEKLAEGNMILQSIEYTTERSGRYRVSCDFLCTDYVGDVQSLMGKDVQIVDISNLSLPLQVAQVAPVAQVAQVAPAKKPQKHSKPKKQNKIKKEIIPPNPINSCFDRMEIDG